MNSPETVKRKRAIILGYPVDLVNMSEALSIAKTNIDNKSGCHIITINPEMIMGSIQNPSFGEILKGADLIIPDGIGIKIVLKKLKLDIEQVPGIEFSEKLIEICSKNEYSVAFLGSSRDVVEAASQNMQKKYPGLNVVFVQDGFFDENEEAKIIESLESIKPNVVFAALGVPKQEVWISQYKNRLNSSIMVGVGGSFDVWANKIQRAPLGFRKLGLEWFYRLITQPSRFNRMFPTLPLFFLKVMFDNKNTRKE